MITCIAAAMRLFLVHRFLVHRFLVHRFLVHRSVPFLFALLIASQYTVLTTAHASSPECAGFSLQATYESGTSEPCPGFTYRLKISKGTTNAAKIGGIQDACNACLAAEKSALEDTTSPSMHEYCDAHCAEMNCTGQLMQPVIPTHVSLSVTPPHPNCMARWVGTVEVGDPPFPVELHKIFGELTAECICSQED